MSTTPHAVASPADTAAGGPGAQNRWLLGLEPPEFWSMERIKRRLDDVPPLVAPARTVSLLGLPAAADVEGQLRVEGLASLLAAKGVGVIAGAPPTRTRGQTAAIWLGDAPDEAQALRRRPPARLLVWPRPERVAEACAVFADWSGPSPVLCLPTREAAPKGSGFEAASTHVLPDPAHALWGLLDHHPLGHGTLELPDGGWDEMLPASRLAALRWCGRRSGGPFLGGLGPRLCGSARRRVLEAARRRVVAHAALSGKRVGGSILAALLGRGFRLPPENTPGNGTLIAAYWADWQAQAPAARG